MEDHNGREDNPTRRVATKGVVTTTKRSMGGTRETSTRGK